MINLYTPIDQSPELWIKHRKGVISSDMHVLRGVAGQEQLLSHKISFINGALSEIEEGLKKIKGIKKDYTVEELAEETAPLEKYKTELETELEKASEEMRVYDVGGGGKRRRKTKKRRMKRGESTKRKSNKKRKTRRRR
jgi:hypothetical protein